MRKSLVGVVEADHALTTKRKTGGANCYTSLEENLPPGRQFLPG